MKTIRLIWYLVVILMFFECKAQSMKDMSLTCNSEVEIQFEKTSLKIKRKGLKANGEKESVLVCFLNNFNQSIKGYVNDELHFEDVVVTDEVTGITDKCFGYNYSNDDLLPVIKIDIEQLSKCFKIEAKRKYKLVYVFLTEGDDIIIRYSNSLYLEN